MIERLSALAIPAVICIAAALMLLGKKDYFSHFTLGAKDGLRTAASILPTLIALMIAINMLTASGILDALTLWLAPVSERVGIPSEILPLLVTRPVSGGASTAAYSALLERYGADSFPALCASVIMGSTDTMLYVICIYFSSVGIKKTRYAIPTALAVMLFSVFFSCLICKLWFK